jgi:hypothetical protein
MARGQKMLKVVGILMIVFGGIGVISGLTTVATLETFLRTTRESFAFLGSSLPGTNGQWAFYYTMGLILSLFDVFVGIMGLKFCSDTSKANLHLAFGISVIGLYLLMYIIGGAMGLLSGFMALTWVAMPIGFVLPILYIVGAVKNKRQ